MERGDEINELSDTYDYRRTALFEVCASGLYDVVRYLVEQGADMEIAEDHGNKTCLTAACYRFLDFSEQVDCTLFAGERSQSQQNYLERKYGVALHCEVSQG